MTLLVTGPAQAAGIYKWTDGDGRVHFGDKPPPEVAETRGVKVHHSPGQAALDIQITSPTIARFEVSGNTRDELNESMARNGPFYDLTQQRHWGMCHWYLDWNYTHKSDEKSCRIDAITIKFLTQFDLPHWTNRASAPRELRKQWEGFERALRTHEDGHRDNGLAATYELGSLLRALPPQPDCATLSREAYNLSVRVIAKFAQRDRDYDIAVVAGKNRRSAFW